MSMLLAAAGVIAQSGSGSVIDSLTWAADMSAARPADYTDVGAGEISDWGVFTQASSADRPLLVSNALGTGYPAIRFAVGDSLDAPDSVIADYDAGYTIYTVLKTPPDGVALRFFDVGAINPIRLTLNMNAATDGLLCNYRTPGGASGVYTHFLESLPESTVVVLAHRFDSVDEIGCYYNGAWDDRTGVPALDSTSGVASLECSAGTLDIGRWLMAATAHDDTTVAAVVAELESEWGI